MLSPGIRMLDERIPCEMPSAGESDQYGAPNVTRHHAALHIAVKEGHGQIV